VAYEISIDKTARTIVITGRGSGTTEQTIAMIAGLAETLRTHANYNVLYDSLQLDIDSSPADMMKVAAALFQIEGVKIPRMAVVVPPVRVALARVFTALANDHDVRANVFSDVAEAMRWLTAPRPGSAPAP